MKYSFNGRLLLLGLVLIASSCSKSVTNEKSDSATTSATASPAETLISSSADEGNNVRAESSETLTSNRSQRKSAKRKFSKATDADVGMVTDKFFNNSHDAYNLSDANRSSEQSIPSLIRPELPVRRFSIQAERDTVLLTPKKVIIRIPKNAFLTEQGKVYQGEVTLKIQEAVDIQEMIRAELPTVSDGKMLNSDGMYLIQAYGTQNQALTLDPKRGMQMKIPRHDTRNNDYLLFTGETQEGKVVNWQVNNNSKPVNDPEGQECRDILKSSFRPKWDTLSFRSQEWMIINKNSITHLKVHARDYLAYLLSLHKPEKAQAQFIATYAKRFGENPEDKKKVFAVLDKKFDKQLDYVEGKDLSRTKHMDKWFKNLAIPYTCKDVSEYALQKMNLTNVFDVSFSGDFDKNGFQRGHFMYDKSGAEFVISTQHMWNIFDTYRDKLNTAYWPRTEALLNDYIFHFYHGDTLWVSKGDSKIVPVASKAHIEACRRAYPAYYRELEIEEELKINTRNQQTRYVGYQISTLGWHNIDRYDVRKLQNFEMELEPENEQTFPENEPMIFAVHILCPSKRIQDFKMTTSSKANFRRIFTFVPEKEAVILVFGSGVVGEWRGSLVSGQTVKITYRRVDQAERERILASVK